MFYTAPNCQTLISVLVSMSTGNLYSLGKWHWCNLIISYRRSRFKLSLTVSSCSSTDIWMPIFHLYFEVLAILMVSNNRLIRHTVNGNQATAVERMEWFPLAQLNSRTDSCTCRRQRLRRKIEERWTILTSPSLRTTRLRTSSVCQQFLAFSAGEIKPRFPQNPEVHSSKSHTYTVRNYWTRGHQ